MPQRVPPRFVVSSVLWLYRRVQALADLVVDQASVLAEADTLLSARGVAARVNKVAGSFFESIPPGCDGYLMKDILHDWDDAACEKILTNVRRAAQPGAHLILAELVIEPDDTRHPGPMVDLHMMMVCQEGRQRSRAEFERLFDKTGFRLDKIVPLPGLESLVVAVAS